MNVITVNINGVEYNLKGEENEEYLHKIARYVDKRLKDILNSNPKLSMSSAAVLTALNASDDLFKCDMAYEELEGELLKLKASDKHLKEELESVKKQLKYLEDYNSELQLKIKNISTEYFLEEKEAEISKLSSELEITQESAKKYLKERNKLIEENKNLKFQVQSYKYKTMDLQNKLIENTIDLAKAKKLSNPLISSES